MAHKLWLTTVVITLLIILGLIIPKQIKRIEQLECANWQKWNVIDFDAGAWASWQIDQCNSYGIDLETK